MTAITTAGFNIVESNIEGHRRALDSGKVNNVDLVIAYLLRIAAYDINGGLNSFTVINPYVFEEAAESDARRAQGLPARPLEGIPYTLKDSYKYAGLTCTNGSPALDALQSSSDSYIASRLRAAGAILIGKTNMPPMAASGMHRGLYGRAESPYNSKYLTAAFSSGSSNGAATATASSMAVFGLGSETVSSGRSPASNNALVCYTPSRGVLSCRGLWPLYVTCDVPVPYARSMDDLLEVLDVITKLDEEVKGDFWREQTHVQIPKAQKVDYNRLAIPDALRGKRIGVPKMYVGLQDSDPHAKPTTVNPDVIKLWDATRISLEALGAEIIYTDFPLVTNYENDSVSGEANNVVGCPPGWQQVERSSLIAKTWNDFLLQNDDPKIKDLRDVDPLMLFPKPKDYLPDTLLETRNWVNYAGLPDLAGKFKGVSVYDIPGLSDAVKALEAQRKRDFEDWMDSLRLDIIAFPSQGDVGFADLEFNHDSATHSHKNGVKYSNGNRAIRHMGVPTVSVPMGIMEGRQMPLNLTFAGKAYNDANLLSYAFAYENRKKGRTSPPLTPALASDSIQRQAPPTKNTLELVVSAEAKVVGEAILVTVHGTLKCEEQAEVEIFLDGEKSWDSTLDEGPFDAMLYHHPKAPERLGWDLKPLPSRDVMVMVVAKGEGARTVAKLLFVSPS